MSELKYDAFISYRHSDIDSKAADDIQKLLERYRIPKSLQKKLGKKEN